MKKYIFLFAIVFWISFTNAQVTFTSIQLGLDSTGKIPCANIINAAIEKYSKITILFSSGTFNIEQPIKLNSDVNLIGTIKNQVALTHFAVTKKIECVFSAKGILSAELHPVVESDFDSYRLVNAKYTNIAKSYNTCILFPKGKKHYDSMFKFYIRPLKYCTLLNIYEDNTNKIKIESKKYIYRTELEKAEILFANYCKNIKIDGIIFENEGNFQNLIQSNLVRDFEIFTYQIPFYQYADHNFLYNNSVQLSYRGISENLEIDRYSDATPPSNEETAEEPPLNLSIDCVPPSGYSDSLENFKVEVPVIPDEDAKFNWKDSTFEDFIVKHFNYPKRCEDNSINGKVTIQFAVDKNGSLIEAYIKPQKTTPACPEFTAEAIRVLKLTKGLWTPGKVNGIPTTSYRVFSLALRVLNDLKDTQTKDKPNYTDTITKNNFQNIDSTSKKNETEDSKMDIDDVLDFEIKNEDFLFNPKIELITADYEKKNVKNVAAVNQEFSEKFEGNPIEPDIDAKFAWLGGTFEDFILQHFNYPKSCEDSLFDGKVLIQFALNTKGQILESYIVSQTTQAGCKEFTDEAIRVLKYSNGLWTAGLKEGKPVKSFRTIRIRLCLRN